MNRQSPIYKTLDDRGKDQKLPSDFSSKVMNMILAEEKRRKRTSLWWAITGYIVAAMVAVFTVVYFCGDIFKEAFRNYMVSLNSQKIELDYVARNLTKNFDAYWLQDAGMIAILVTAATILLVLDHFFRKRFAMRDI